MGRVALLFPGQGSQEVGMGRAVYEASDAARAVFDQADEALGFSLSKLCFEGPEEDLRLTENTQPAVLTTSVALLAALEVPFDAVAGHSLGEYSAHVAAGSLAFGDAVKLVRQRGRFMQTAVPDGQGAMAAVLKADRPTVEAICARTSGVVELVNFNCPGQIVIAGEADAVTQASAVIDESGSKARPLPVSAPFHSSLMQPAEAQLAPVLADTAFCDPRVPVYANVNAKPVTDAQAARDALREQVSRPVLWEQSIVAMIADGVTVFVEVGAGKVLTGMVRRIDREITRISVQQPADFDAARGSIAAAQGA